MIETAYLLQSVLIILWWLGISFSDSFYEVFAFPGIERGVFFAFLIPDIAIIAALSVIRGYRHYRDIQLIILGAFLYATFFCINASIISGGGFLSTSVMTLGLGYNAFLCYGNKMFRPASIAGFYENAFKTLIQTACVWFLALALFPILILKAFGLSLMPEIGASFWIGAALFFVCSCLGISSSYVMVKFGRGTPLPLDQTNHLVVEGPYRYVRNPMAVAGIGQGIAVAIIYGSFPILFYAALGAVVWHLVVRPIEERDLLMRFGDAYRAYQSKVRCWIPKFN